MMMLQSNSLHTIKPIDPEKPPDNTPTPAKTPSPNHNTPNPTTSPPKTSTQNKPISSNKLPLNSGKHMTREHQLRILKTQKDTTKEKLLNNNSLPNQMRDSSEDFLLSIVPLHLSIIRFDCLIINSYC